MNSIVYFRNVRRVISFQLLCLAVAANCSFSQNKVAWSSFNMGFAKSQTPGTVVKSVAGQNFVGVSLQPGTHVISGFLADTLLRALPVAVPEQEGIPLTYSLEQNYPNPFNPSTIITFQMPTVGFASLKVYDILGREVATLVNETKQPGKYTVQWDAGSVANGMYFYRVLVQGGEKSFVDVKKMVLLK